MFFASTYYLLSLSILVHWLFDAIFFWCTKKNVCQSHRNTLTINCAHAYTIKLYWWHRTMLINSLLRNTHTHTIHLSASSTKQQNENIMKILPFSHSLSLTFSLSEKLIELSVLLGTSLLYRHGMLDTVPIDVVA